MSTPPRSSPGRAAEATDRPAEAAGPAGAAGRPAGAAGRAAGAPSAREVARRALRRVAEGGYATLSLSSELSRAGLSPLDRALATELTYGVLRRRLYLDWALSHHAPRGLGKLDDTVRDALRLGAYQILLMRLPDHAAVSDAVSVIRRLRSERLAGFANALLRRLASAGPPPLPEVLPERLSLVGSLPLPIAVDLITRLGPAEAERLALCHAEPAPLWLRLNPLRGSREEALSALSAEVERLLPSPRLPDAVQAHGRSGLLSGPAFGQGWFAVQDLGAQLVAQALCDGPLPQGPLLDACAGVGGKSAHLCALTGDSRPVVAADLSSRKLELCGESARRLGLRSLTTRLLDLTDASALPGQFAAVLLDAPCSGLGVLRRHPEARWRPGATPIDQGELAAPLQHRLLSALADRVQPGGVLVYSVCTYTDQEGPAQMARFLHERPDFRPAPPQSPAFSGLHDPTGALRTWPHRDEADAFYIMRLARAAH